MKKYISILMAAMLAVLSLAACGQKMKSDTSTASDDGVHTIKIVTTIFPEYDWVKEILGEEAGKAELIPLFQDGVDLHNFQPTAEDMLNISTCDLFIYVGGESDAWVEDALKAAKNKERKVLKLIDVLGDSVKEEEIKEGMEAEHGHSHGKTQFEDNEVKDRKLTDWTGEWQSVYPYLLSGELDEVMEHKAEEDDQKTAADYRAYYEKGYQTDVEKIQIDGEEQTIEFLQNGISKKTKYEYRGYQIYTYESGNKGVRYFFESNDKNSDAPEYVQFSDHEIEPTEVEHFHIYFGNEGFDKLSEEMENWPTYYGAELSGKEIAEEMMGHDHGESLEYDEHVWLSLNNAKTICKEIAETMCEIDPGHEATYKKNLSSYEEKLEDLNQQYQTAVEQAAGKTVLFGDRFPFRYLTDDYGLEYYAAFVGCSAETEASFETITFLADKVDEIGLSYVMTIEKSDQQIAKTIINNTKKKDQQIATLNSMQSITADSINKGISYLSVMTENLDVLKAVLK